MNIIHKIGIAIILIIAGFWGSAYLFNHVNPWLGIAAPVVAIIIVLENRAVDVVFNNANLAGDNFMSQLENNVLEPRIYDISKDISRKYVTDTLMSTGGNLRYEREVRDLVEAEFNKMGIELETFTLPLVATQKVQDKIDTRNEVNTNLSVLDQQIQEQRKKNELAELRAMENVIISRGLTPQILQQQFYETWQKATVPLYGNIPYLYKNVP